MCFYTPFDTPSFSQMLADLEHAEKLKAKYGIAQPMAPEDDEDPLDRTRREANAILARASAPSETI